MLSTHTARHSVTLSPTIRITFLSTNQNAILRRLHAFFVCREQTMVSSDGDVEAD